MWLDPLVERRHLKNINVTTNLFNIRMEILKEKFAADNKQVLFFLQLHCCNEEQSVLREGGEGKVRWSKLFSCHTLIIFSVCFLLWQHTAQCYKDFLLSLAFPPLQ